MENTFNGFINYGCLAAEKRQVWTAGNPQPTATVSDAVEYTVPDGWELGWNEIDDPIITAPWGWDYSPNELLGGNEDPYFIGVDKDGNEFKIKVKWQKK